MRVACVQADVVYGDPAANTARAVAELRRLAAEGVHLAVFPEAFLTGYCVECADDAQSIAIAGDGLSAQASTLQGVVEETGIVAVVGFAERDGERVRNSAALFEPGVPVRVYRKVHLPELGLDKFVQPGDELPVFDTRAGKIGILICFDLRPPEAARVLALRGAEIIVLPTNWPVGAEVSAEHISIARAAESRVFVATCNRIGEENGFRFIGRSKIVSPAGRVLAAAGDGEETILADIDLAEAREKRTVGIPGRYETTVFDSRRPDLYEVLLEAANPEAASARRHHVS